MVKSCALWNMSTCISAREVQEDMCTPVGSCLWEGHSHLEKIQLYLVEGKRIVLHLVIAEAVREIW